MHIARTETDVELSIFWYRYSWDKKWAESVANLEQRWVSHSDRPAFYKCNPGSWSSWWSPIFPDNFLKGKKMLKPFSFLLFTGYVEWNEIVSSSQTVTNVIKQKSNITVMSQSTTIKTNLISPTAKTNQPQTNPVTYLWRSVHSPRGLLYSWGNQDSSWGL